VGNQLIQAPDYNASLGVDWRFARIAAGRSASDGGCNCTPSQYFERIQHERIAQGAYGVANARVSFEARQNRFGAGLDQNIANRKVLATASTRTIRTPVPWASIMGSWANPGLTGRSDLPVLSMAPMPRWPGAPLRPDVTSTPLEVVTALPVRGTARPPVGAPLQTDARTEVAVVGAGYTVFRRHCTSPSAASRVTLLEAHEPAGRRRS